MRYGEAIGGWLNSSPEDSVKQLATVETRGKIVVVVLLLLLLFG